MPKKHAPAYAHTKPSYVHPSLQSSRSSAPTPTSSPATPPSVNERIQQLRREQAPRATVERRDEITEVVTHRTVPPDLRRILRLAEVDSPPPKPGLRRTPRPGARPPPGPAAPSSWLDSSRHAPPHIRNLRKYLLGEGYGRERFCALARVHDKEYKERRASFQFVALIPRFHQSLSHHCYKALVSYCQPYSTFTLSLSQRLPNPQSLVHSCLKTFAIHWEELAEYEQHYLPTLPVQLKEALLSYLSIYGGKECLDLRSLKILFGNGKELDGGSGSEEILFLDLTGLLSLSYTLADLNKSLTRSFPSAAAARGHPEQSGEISKRKEKAPVEVADSWEDEVDEPSTPTIASTLSVPLFPNLTRLSLAHPGNYASWADLLTLSGKLNTITHLSLGYWPTPSTTPNAATTSMVSSLTKPVALGGSHFYSELDDDWHEAANILRRLSQNTYCLKWLDLEGCTWLKAFTWDYPNNHQRRGRLGVDDEWVRPTSQPGPDWNGSWRQIEYLNLYQGWIPKDAQSLRTMPAGVVPVQLLNWLREHEDDEECQLKFRSDTGYAVTEWVEREKVARSIAFEIHQMRKAGGGKWCEIDHGWEPVTTAPKQKAS